MEIKINKDIQDYKQTVYGNLTLRELLSAIVAVGGSLAIFFLTHKAIGTDLALVLCAILSAICLAFGFYNKEHYNFEERLALDRRDRETPEALLYGSENQIINEIEVKEREEENRYAQLRKHLKRGKSKVSEQQSSEDDPGSYAALPRV